MELFEGQGVFFSWTCFKVMQFVCSVFLKSNKLGLQCFFTFCFFKVDDFGVLFRVSGGVSGAPSLGQASASVTFRSALALRRSCETSK